MKAKLLEIKEALRERRHVPIPEVGKWLAQVVSGYFACHAAPTNSPALNAFRYHVVRLCSESGQEIIKPDQVCVVKRRTLSNRVSKIESILG